MTHAFFKALLFMAAGSIIAAMANRQDIDRMSGFRRAMPFTGAMLVIGSLALSGFTGTSGFFSKDEILAFASDRGSFYWIFTIGGYIGALMTAVYSFRLVFRVLGGEECDEARELRETGHVVHAEPENPATGEAEDTDVGYPGAEHHIAEQAPPMRIAMGALGFLALFAGLIQVPGVDNVIHNFLAPTFEASPLEQIEPSTAASWEGLGVGTLISLLGIGIAYQLYVRNPGTTARLIERLRGLHSFLLHKWYFDELIDVLIVQPALAIGRFCNGVFERFVVQGIVNGTVEVVRDAAGVVRNVQSGFLRSYALLLVTGFAALALYFLLSSS
jgi:NADH-quinone oxidoreductase subunit L